MSITSWIEYEYQTLIRLYAAGADVPKPVAQSGNAILMGYIGEAGNPAPTLNNVSLRREEAVPLFERLIGNVRLMLEHDLIHADLSAYNVLYWEGSVTIIDFPQAVDPRRNPDASALFIRDVERVCQYFARYQLAPNPHSLASDLWSQYQRANAFGDITEELLL
jgi:RIO kinase 1